MNKEKIKTITVVFLILSLIIVCVFLFKGTNQSSIGLEEQRPKTNITQSNASDIDYIDNSVEIKENVCRNFLTTYYNVYHAKSKLVNLPDCKKYLTDYLYSSLSPNSEDSPEYSADEIDVDYNSSISINQCYQDINNSNKLLVSCSIKKTVNELQSINDYYVLFTLEESEDGWLINHFDLISQGA